MFARGKHTGTLSVIGAPAVPANLAFLHKTFQCVPYTISILWIEITYMELVQIDLIAVQAA